MISLGVNDKNIQILEKFESGEQVAIRFAFPSRETMASINGFLSRILGNADMLFLQETIITILRESLLNALKANSKRLFFEKSGVDINNTETYNKAMITFRERVIGDMAVVESDLKASNYYIDFRIQKIDGSIKIRIENNTGILPTEQLRINKRLQNAQQYKDFTEAYDALYDETEGAGLGLILTVLLLRNCGIPAGSFLINSDGVKTETSLTIPLQIKPLDTVAKIKKEILNEIHVLPTFPDYIIELQGMCNDPKSSISIMAEKVKTDPALTIDILKLANSAGFAGVKRIETIAEALTRIGLSNFKYLLIAASTRKIMDSRYKKFEQIWQHCLKTAIYARQMSLLYKMNSVSEQIFISALLHDLGKLILLSVDATLTNWIADFVQSHGIRTTTILEEVAIGVSHSTIGKLITEKWNLPEFLIETIACHHAPLQCKNEFRDIVYTTYLANILCGVESKKYDYFYIEPAVLQRFNINDEAGCIELHQKLKDAHNSIIQ
jgi:HD-like signal output (HDOD) protein